jgi:hypothetical protein
MTTYNVRITRHYYGYAKRTTFAADEYGAPAEFRTRAAAREWISERDAGEYRMEHNECSRPTYRIVVAGEVRS